MLPAVFDNICLTPADAAGRVNFSARCVTERTIGNPVKIRNGFAAAVTSAAAASAAVTITDTRNREMAFSSPPKRMVSIVPGITDIICALIMVLHDLNLASEYAHHLILIHGTDGTIFRAGRPEQVITPAVIEAVYHTPVLVQQHPVSGKPYILMP